MNVSISNNCFLFTFVELLKAHKIGLSLAEILDYFWSNIGLDTLDVACVVYGAIDILEDMNLVCSSYNEKRECLIYVYIG